MAPRCLADPRGPCVGTAPGSDLPDDARGFPAHPFAGEGASAGRTASERGLVDDQLASRATFGWRTSLCGAADPAVWAKRLPTRSDHRRGNLRVDRPSLAPLW